MNRRARVGIFVLTTPLFAWGGAALVAGADSPTISQFNRQFAPGQIQIARGTVVHFINDDNVTHHVFIDSPTMQFDSGEQPVGKTVDVNFAKPGTYTVLCAIHPTMHLKVTVE